MTNVEVIFHSIANELLDVKEGKMFGTSYIKTPNGKAGVMFLKDEMIFKLEEKMLEDTLKLKEAKLFDQMDGKPTKRWVQVPFEHHLKWKELAIFSTELVRKIKS